MTDPFAQEPETVDISQWAKSLTTAYGRQHELQQVEAQTIAAVMDNVTGLFSAWNFDSPFTNLLDYIDSSLAEGEVGSWLPGAYTDLDVTGGGYGNCPCLFLSGQPAYDTLMASLTPRGWWKQNDAVDATQGADSSGNGLTGSYTSGTTLGQTGPITGTPTDTAALYTGSQVLAVSDNALLDFGTGSFWVIGWINTTQSTGFPGLISKGGAVPTAGYQLQMTSAGYLEIKIGDGTTSVAVEPAIAYNDGNWHMAVGVINRSSNLLSLYVDGAQVGTSVSIASVGSVTSTASLFMGAVTSTIAQSACGAGILTSSQVAALYAAHTPQNISASNGAPISTLGISVIGGKTYTSFASFATLQTARQCTIQTNWYESDGVTLISSSVSTAVTDELFTDTQPFTKATITAQAPSNAAFATLTPLIEGVTSSEIGHLVTRMGMTQRYTDMSSGAILDVNAWGPGGYGLAIGRSFYLNGMVSGETYPLAFGYLEKNVPTIRDELYKEVSLNVADGLKYMANDVVKSSLYPGLVVLDGAAAYLRMNDPAGTELANDFSLNGVMGNVDVVNGSVTFGQPGMLNQDPGTSVLIVGSTGSTTPAGAYITTAPISPNPSASELLSFEFIFQAGEAGLLPAGFSPLVFTNDFSIGIDTSGRASAFSGSLVGTTNICDGEPHTILMTYDGSTGRTILATASVVEGSNILTDSGGSFTTADVGQSVWDADISVIPLGTTITGLISATQVTMSNVSTVSTSGETVIVGNGAVFLYVDGGIGRVIVSTIDLSSGSPTMTDTAGSFTTADVGLPLTGTDIPIGTFIQAYISATQVTMSQNATGNVTAGTVDVGNPIRHASVSTGLADTSALNIQGLQTAAGSYIQEVAVYPLILSDIDAAAHYDLFLEGFSIPGGSADVGGSTTTDIMIALFLLAAQFPLELLSFEMGDSEVYCPTLTVGTSTLISTINSIVASEQGILYQDRTGQFVFLNRHYQISAPTSTDVQATFENSEASGLYYKAQNFQPVLDDEDLWNDVPTQVSAGGSGGTAGFTGPLYDISDANSITRYGQRSLQGYTSMLFADDSDTVYLGEYLLGAYSQPYVRIREAQIDSVANGGANLVQMMERDLLDLLAFIYHPQDAGQDFNEEAQIEKIQQKITPGPYMITTLQLTPYVYGANAWFILNDPVQGVLAGPGSSAANRLAW